MPKNFLFLFSLLLSWSVWATPPAVYRQTTDLDLDTAYQRVHDALEANQFWVVFEADLGARMANFKERWGDDYNRQGLTGARSLVFCNLWWTNALASGDPDLLSLCPLHLALYGDRAGRVSVVLVRPSAVAEGSPARSIAEKLEKRLIDLIDRALAPKD